MGLFWTSWQLWEKMCFCLAGSIVLVIIGGCIKLVYNHWRIRKYTKIAEERRAKMMEKRQRQALGSLRRLQAVPFGIRAIESGVEVDGVWISRQNSAINFPPSTKSSPLSGRSASPSPPNGLVEKTSGTSTPLRDSTVLGSHGLPSHIRESTNPYFAGASHSGPLQEESPLPTPRADARSARQSALIPEPQEPATSYSQPRSSNAFVASPQKSMTNPTGDMAGSIQPLRPRKTPSSSTGESQSARPKSKRYSQHSSVNATLPLRSERSDTMSTQSPSYEPTVGESSTMSESDRSERSRTLRVPREPLQVRYPRASNGQEMSEVMLRSPIDARPFLEGRKSSNLDFLQGKRKSHAAETGQLTPRSRPETIADYQERQSGEITPKSALNSHSVKQEKRKSTSSGAKDQFKSASTSAESSAPGSGYQTPRSVIHREDLTANIGIAVSNEPQAPTTRSYVAGPTEEPHPSLGPPRFEPRVKANQAVRKVNSAFEVLPAGTFPPQEAPQEEDKRVSLDMDGKPKRLQKKNRSRSNSVARRSVFDENC